MDEGGTHLLVAPSFCRSGGLLSLRAISSLLDVGKDFVPILHIGSVMYDVVISKPTNRALENMPDLDLSEIIRLSAHSRKRQQREEHTP
jgi:hypothetical protein